MNNFILTKVLDLIDSGYWKGVSWKEWADAVISKSDEPPYWVIQLGMAMNSGDAVSVLREKLAEIQYVDEVNHKSIVLGYMFLRYKEKEISLQEFLIQAWQETEADEDLGVPTNVEIFEMYETCKNLPEVGEGVECFVKQVTEAFFDNYCSAAEALSEVNEIVSK